MRVAVVASAQIFGGFQNLPPPQSLDFSAFFGLSHLFPPRPFYSHIFDTDLVTSQKLGDEAAATVYVNDETVKFEQTATPFSATVTGDLGAAAKVTAEAADKNAVVTI